ncbi:transglutaminase-like cysteine peptidase [uncultured Desulfovibrio sp.]|uniref:transglutaminase-like cysteine peptidase n=1 Tax=uncultured Desulfovibrio sp. TaxID=167968 RepID=UPI00266D60C3|nr:transglutaminase-like cysteine peptidase [uncultured Desulfovibrio sp.]
MDQAAPDNPAAVRPQSAGPPQSRADAVASLPAVDQESSPAAPAKPSTPPHTTLRLFGTVEFRRPLSSLPGWLELLKRNAQHGIFTPGQVLKKGVTWAQFRAGAAGKKGVSLLRYVNAFWNAWPYREDRDVWGREDYWAIPQEFLRRSGDCEDYAIIKYFTLKELGLSPKTMRIVVVRDTVRNLGHAVLAVYMDGTVYILDNLSNAILPHDRLRQYRPQYSVNEQGRWAHLQVSRVP